MKKSLQRFSMLILSIGVFSTNTFAQDDSGGSSFNSISVDGGGTIQVAPPAGVKSVKRNNGNATAYMGTAEARLNFTKNFDPYGIELESISYLLDVSSAKISGTVTSNTNDFARIENGYISYPLGKNINPAKKLLFHFKRGSQRFSIPETN